MLRVIQRVLSMSLITKKTALVLLTCGVISISPQSVFAGVSDTGDTPVDFSSNELTYDEVAQVVTAKGNVEIIQGGRTVNASEVSYDLKSDVMKAFGDVILVDENGDTHFSQEAQLEKSMSNGFVKELKSILADGSRFTAEEGERIDATVIKMRKATYTPCKVCEVPSSGKPDVPDWQIKAREVVHNKATQTISYDDATFELFGVPVAYTPFFSHPDGTVKKKSGFLPPSFSAGTNLGFGVTSQYYWDIAPSLDATIGARVYSSDTPLFLGEIRKRYDDASIKANAGLTYSDRNGIADDQDIRGHFFGEGLWNINDKWRAGIDIAYASDDQYMRQYDITSDDVLDSQLYLERFDQRDYASVRTLYFQDIRVDERDAEQPSIFPEIETSFIGDPNAVLGGRWDAAFSSLGLVRDGREQDSYRFTSELGWQRKHTSKIGLINSLDLSVRGDLYASNDLQSGNETDARDARAFPTAHFVSRLPLVKPISEKRNVIIEPIVALTARTNVSENRLIPNEDSQDVQIDASNLFEADRFPGYDRVEDKARATYGVRTGVYEDNGSKLEAFIGQSYRFSDDVGFFPTGSGLDEQSSDVVGELSFDYKTDYTLDYRFQFGSRDFHSKRHELDASANFGRFDMNTTYLYAEALGGTDIDENREQMNVNVRTRLADQWYFRSGALYDLGEDEGLRQSILGLDYEGQCLSLGASLRRSLTSESAGENATTFYVTVGLKNLGQFEGGK